MKQCTKCGCVNSDINNYCRNCGNPFITLTDGEKARAESTKSTPEAENKRADARMGGSHAEDIHVRSAQSDKSERGVGVGISAAAEKAAGEYIAPADDSALADETPTALPPLPSLDLDEDESAANGTESAGLGEHEESGGTHMSERLHGSNVNCDNDTAAERSGSPVSVGVTDGASDGYKQMPADSFFDLRTDVRQGRSAETDVASSDGDAGDGQADAEQRCENAGTAATSSADGTSAASGTASNADTAKTDDALRLFDGGENNGGRDPSGSAARDAGKESPDTQQTKSGSAGGEKSYSHILSDAIAESGRPGVAFIDFDTSDAPVPAPKKHVGSDGEKSAVGQSRLSTHPVIDALRHVWGGGVMLAANICMSFAVAAALLSLLLPFTIILLTDDGAAAPDRIFIISVEFLSLLISALLIAGIWRLWYCACDRRKNWFATGGVTLVRSSLVMFTVVCALGTLFSAGYLGSLVFDGIGKTSGLYTLYGGADVRTTAKVLAASTWGIVFSALTMRALGAIRKVARTGKSASGVSIAFIVMCFASAVAVAVFSPALSAALVLYGICAVFHRVKVGGKNKK